MQGLILLYFLSCQKVKLAFFLLVQSYVNFSPVTHIYTHIHRGFPGGSEVKASACSTGDLGSIPGWGRSLGEGNGNPVQYSCLENAMDSRAWQAIGYGVTKSWIQRSNYRTVPLKPWQVLKGSNFQNLASHVKNDQQCASNISKK